jgi:nucleoid DNA-binding protein
MSNTKQKVIIKFKDDAFVEQLERVLLSSGKVKVGGLGIFEIRAVKAREGYNVGSGERITIPAHNKIVFRPTKSLRDAVQEYN